MLQFFFRWRYERRSRANAYKLPGPRDARSVRQANLGSYLARQSPGGRGFRHHDRPYRRRRWLRLAFLLAGIVFLIWVVYESYVALSLMGR